MALDNQFEINELIAKAIKSKDDKGVHTYYADDKTDGLAISETKMPDYNDDELKKAVDLIVSELIPENDADRILSVRKELYDRLINEIDDLAEQLRQRNATIDTLRAEIDELILQIESLKVEIDLEKTLRAALEDEYKSLNEKYITLLDDFQSALTKGILETIERSSLFAQNTALQKQVDSLTEQLFGKTAKIQQGAKAALSFTVRALGGTGSSNYDITYRMRSNVLKRTIEDGNGGIFVNGAFIEIYNFTKKPITIGWRVDANSALTGEFVNSEEVDKNNIRNFIKPGKTVIPAQSSFFIRWSEGNIDEYKAEKLPPNKGFTSRTDREYGSEIIFENVTPNTNVRSDDSITLSYVIQKQVGDKWTG